MNKYLLIFIVAIFSNLWAQNEIRIAEIKVFGATISSEASVVANSQLRVGQDIQYSVDFAGNIISEEIQRAIKNLWNIGVFSEIAIHLLEETGDGIVLEIVVAEYPRLSKLIFQGNKKIKEKALSEIANLYSGQVVSGYKIWEAEQSILEKYHEKGYIRASIRSEQTANENNQMELSFIIEEGVKVKIGQIAFSESLSFSDSKLKRQMKNTKEFKWYWAFGKSEYNEEKLEEDFESLRTFYLNRGYRDVVVDIDSTYFSKNGKRINLNIQINEGEKYKFGSFSWDGNNLYTADQLNSVLAGGTVDETETFHVLQEDTSKSLFSLKNLFMTPTTIRTGQKYNKEAMDFALERIISLYMNKGHLFFNIIPQEIPKGKDTIDVHFALVEGHPVTIREIKFSSNTKTYENVIRREFKSYPGDIFNRESLMRSIREVFILNYFSNVEPQIQPVNDALVDLNVVVEEKEGGTDRANASAGFSQRDGIIGSVGMEFNNFLGKGQQLMLNYQRASYFQSASFGFTEPWLFDRPNLVGFNLFYTERGNVNQFSSAGYTGGDYYLPFDIHETGGSVSFGHRFKWPDNYFRGTWRFQASQKQYANIHEDGWDILYRINPAAKNNPEIAEEPIVGINIKQTIRRDSRDRAEFPTYGSVLSWATTLSGGPLLRGDEEFLKTRFELDWYIPLLPKFVFYQSTSVGVLNKFHSKAIVPYTEFFYMGGAGLTLGDALRGYEERSVGPMNADGYPSGASFLWKYSAELRFSISEQPMVYALAFFETGNTWESALDANLFDLKRSVGIGGRMYMQMIGEIGFDYAYGFDKLSPGWKPHIIFGRPF